MRTPRVLAPGEVEERGDFETGGGLYPPTSLQASPESWAGFVWATDIEDVLGFLAAAEQMGTTAGSAEPIARLLCGFGHSPSYGRLGAVNARRARERLMPLFRPFKEAEAVQQPESPQDIARRMALRAPAVPVEPFIPVASANAARDLRDWTQLTVQELAAMCHVTARRFQHWLQGAAMSSRREERLLRLRYFAAILAAAFGPAGARRWFRAPHPELGTTPIEAMVGGRDDAVQRLVEHYIESPAT